MKYGEEILEVMFDTNIDQLKKKFLADQLNVNDVKYLATIGLISIYEQHSPATLHQNGGRNLFIKTVRRIKNMRVLSF